MGALEQQVVQLRAEVSELRVNLDDAIHLISVLKEDIQQRDEEILELRRQVKDLKDKLEEKSNEKREPPAFVKPNKRKGRRKNRRGPPEGHPGTPRPAPEEVDEEDEVVLESCPRCGNDLPEPFDLTEHVVEDIVPAHVVVTRHWTAWHWCPTCKEKVQAPLPDAFPKERFGINLMVLVSYHRILGQTVGKIRALLKEQYGLDVCDATVLRMERRVAEEMGEHYSELVEAVRAGKAVHIDETGWRVDGRNHWLWTCASKEATIFHVDPRRNGKVAKRLLGKRRDGRVVVSDFYPAYNCVADLMQRCLEHLKREFEKVEARKKRTTEQFKRFKRRVLRLLRDAFRIHENIRDKETRERRVALLHRRLRTIYEETYSDPDCQRIAKRLRRHKDELFTFLEVEGVDWHNNEAERALRPMVVARKNSYGSRTIEGARDRAVLMSVSDSARKRGERYTDFARGYLSTRALNSTSKC